MYGGGGGGEVGVRGQGAKTVYPVRGGVGWGVEVQGAKVTVGNLRRLQEYSVLVL